MLTPKQSPTVNPPCVQCLFYHPSQHGAQFSKCTRLPMYGTKLLLGAAQCRADEARCGQSGKWFQEASQ